MRTLLLLATAFALHAQNALHVDLTSGWKQHLGDRPEFAQPDFDDSNWSSVPSPSVPRRQTGIVWLRRQVDLPANADLTQLALTLGSVDDFYQIHVNGTAIGGTGFDRKDWQIARPRTFVIPPGALTGTHRLVIAIRGAPFNAGLPINWTRYPAGPYLLTYTWNAPQDAGRVSIDLRRLFIAPGFLFALVYLLLGILLLLTRGTNPSLELWLSAFLLLAGGRELLYDSFVSESSFPLRWGYDLTRMVTLAKTAVYVGFAAALNGFAHRRLTVALAATWALCAAITGVWQNYLFASLATRAFTMAGIALCAAGLWRLGPAPVTRAWLLRATALLVGLAWLNTYIGGGLFQRSLVLGPFDLQISQFMTLLLCSLLAAQFLSAVASGRRENQRLAAEMEAARQVQRFLISSASTSLAGYQIESVYLPAAEVGGDFWQSFALPDGGLLIAVGDVSGKGLKAAMLVAMIAGALRNRKGDDPAAVLEELNRVLASSAEGGFVTAALARLWPDGRSRIASAGHLPPYRDGIELQLPSGLPLGLDPAAVYDEYEFRLEASQRLTFVSDGVLEAENPQRELFGFDRTREISTQSAQQIADAAQAWGQNDDITVVTVGKTNA